jgi:hypothetical protein
MTPPLAPQEVIAVWKSAPSPSGFPPTISKQITLGKYIRDNDYSYGSIGSFEQDQWVDIIVKSVDVPVVFSSPDAGLVSVVLEATTGNQGTLEYGPRSWDRIGTDYQMWGSVAVEAGGIPLMGRYLYMPSGYTVTNTETNKIYTTAYRFFITGAAASYEFRLTFVNHDPSKTANVTYEVYPLAKTPGWSNYFDNTLKPWLNLFSQGQQTTDALSRWMQQFK